jgi:hypothetical protein
MAEDRKLNLFVGGVEIEEQFVDLIDYFFGPGIVAIDFIDHGDCGQTRLRALRKTKRVCGAAFGSIDQGVRRQPSSKRARPRRQSRVAGRVDDIDLVIA